MTKFGDAAGLKRNCYPLIVFIHVPKAAGTTITTILRICTPHGNDAAHHILGDRTAFLELARCSDWISGHAARDEFAVGLTWLDSPAEYFASVREPLGRLISHLNYAFVKYSRADYHSGIFRADEQLLNAEVMSTNFCNPDAVMALLLRRADNFLNIQARYVLGADFAQISESEIARRLRTYTYVASEVDLQKLYRAFGFAQLPADADQIRENATKRCFDPQIFDSPQLREFLAYHNQHDDRLYAAVRSASWPAEGRPPFRRVLLEQRVTSENFDEQIYLECHPDVAVAVKLGQVESGRAHFEFHGQYEGRTVRRLVVPSTACCELKPAEADLSLSEVLGRLRRMRADRARIAAEVRSARGAAAKQRLTAAPADG